MKRFFTLAIVAMIASLSFAQAPAVKTAAKKQIQKVMTTAQLQDGMAKKAAIAEKAKAAQESSSSVLRHAQRPATAVAKQMTPARVISSALATRPAPLGQYAMPQFKNKNGVISIQKVENGAKVKNYGYNANAPRMATPKMGADSATVIVATQASAEYYAEDGDWFCVLLDAQNAFTFDIVTNNPAPLELNHVYSLADMDPSYSYCQVGGSSTKKQYAAATFMAKQGAYGTDYEATATLTTGEVYQITYTSVAPETVDVEATTASAKWYGEPDNDWFILLSNENFEFRFDIVDQSADGLILDHEYTMANMLDSYSWGKNKATGASIKYKTVSFKATTGANGTDYVATVVDNSNNTYNITYTTIAPPPTTETVEIEFTSAETDLVDAAASMGLIQFVGSKEDTGLEAYIGLITDQVAGTYDFSNVEQLYTSIYLDFTDYTGVACADLNGTVTDLGNGAYKAVFEYTGANGILYKLTYNYGEAGEESAGDVTVTKDAHGIITSVTGGTEKNYARSADGTVYFVSNSQLSMGAQSGNVTVIEDGDKVYIKDPIARFTNNTWVEGTKNGNQIIVATNQPMYYSSNYDATVSLRWGVIAASGNLTNADGHADNFVYTIDGNTLTLEGTAAFGNVNGDAYFMGGFWDDDDSFQAGEAETVLTYDPTYVAPTTDLVELPAGADVMNWNMSGTQVTSSSQNPFQNQAVNVAFVGNELYLQGLFKDFPTSWVKGTIEGNTVTFNKLQYIGNYGGSYDIFFAGTDGQNLTNATATISADAQTISFTTGVLANAATDRIYYLTWLDNVVISAAPAEEPVITDLTATLPYVNGFDNENEQAEAAIYDANGDGRTFTFASDSKSSSVTARYTYSTANNGDDYVVFPGLALEAGKSYKVSVDARPYSASFPERLEVVAGKVAKASDLNISIIPATDLASSDYQTLTAEFTPDSTGTYYFALHAISDKDQFYLYTDNFSVKENDMNAPVAPTNLEVIADANGANLATVKVKAPAVTIAGASITENIDLVISRNGENIYSTVATAGQAVEYVDTVPAPGTYKYSAIAMVAESISDPVSVDAYVGEDIPTDVLNLAGADADGKVNLTWEAPTTGQNNGIIIPENLRYNVYPVEMFEFWGMVFPEIDFENPYATELTETNATVDFDTNAGEQAYTYFGVTASNAAGESMGEMAAVLTGAAYELPFHESFDGGISYWWGVDYDENIENAEGGLGISQEGEIVFQAPVAGWIKLMSGKIAINSAENPGLTFDSKGANFEVKVYGPAGEPIVKNIAATSSYETQTIELSSLSDQPWVRFDITANFTNAGEAFVDNVNVLDLVSNDLAVAVSAPKSLTAGKTATIKATVQNLGQEAAKDYTVKFYVNEEVIAEVAADTTALQFFASKVYETEFATSIFDEADDYTVKAEVVYTLDTKPENNVDEVIMSLVAPSAAPVENLTAESTADGIVINWTVAENSAAETTEDFESYEVGIVADGETMGPWSAKDGDQGMGYGWSSSSIAWDYTGEAYAFAIMNFPTVFGSATDIEATSGEQALMFMSVTDKDGNGFPADDWFISPELPGVAQTITFQARPMTAQYGAEIIEVMASEDGQNWNKIETFNLEEEEFVECAANLPAGTKYFALHYVSNDVFAAFVDDLTYTVGGANPTGFNVYVDQVLVKTLGADARSYTHYSTEGNHEIAVTALYNDSESAPVTTTVSVATGIQEINTANAKAEIYTIDGVRVSNLKKAGVYVINGRKAVIK